MTKLRVRQFEPEDFATIELYEEDKKNRELFPMEDLAIRNKAEGPALTVVDPENRIVVVCGIRQMWRGVGNLWTIFSPLAKKYVMTRKVLQVALGSVCKTHGFKRVQISIDVGLKEVITLLERLEFKRECTMRRYGRNGQDYFLYSLILEKQEEENGFSMC